MITIYLGNRDAVELATDDDGDEVRTSLPPGKRCTTITPPDGIPLAELFATVTHPGRGVWACHSVGPPAWVAVSADDPAFASALASLLAAHYGCEVRDPDPEGT